MAYALYTVQQDDEAEGLLGIARRLYGSGRHWSAIYDVNRYVIGINPSIVRTGQQLIIPYREIDAEDDAGFRRYVVQIDDISAGLEGIAARLWGLPERWRDLYTVNRGAIGDDPRAIQPGQALIIP